MRKPHTKSRLGCQQCKQRKVKCDETKPACQRCSSVKRHCSFLGSIADLPTPASSVSTVHSHRLLPCARVSHPPYDVSGVSTPADGPYDQLFDPSYTSESYSLLHLELFDHLRNGLVGSNHPSRPALDRLLHLALTEGLRVPCLMDELLAFAAAHKSTLSTGGLQRFYRDESTTLQTRALSKLRASQAMLAEDSSLALFFFSAILGQHVLFEVFSDDVGLATLLDKLVQCFELHHGIRVIASKGWEGLRDALHDVAPDDIDPSPATVPGTTTGDECGKLIERLEAIGMDQSTLSVYKDTVNILQYLFGVSHSSPARKVMILQEWLVRMPSEYISLLRQRRPEALVVLAHYAVLLHHARDYWAIGHSGWTLFCAITGHLGDYWADWLAWPRHAIEQS